MEKQIFDQAMNLGKTVFGMQNSKNGFWKIYPISIEMTCVVHKIWIDDTQNFVHLNCIMTKEEAYGITKTIDINWEVSNKHVNNLQL